MDVATNEWGFAATSTTDLVCQILAMLWGQSGICHSIIYSIIFYKWKKKHKHKFRFNLKLIIKWQILFAIALTMYSFVFISIKTHASDFFEATRSLSMISLSFWIYLLSRIAYKFSIVDKYELIVPFMLWSPAIFLMGYKRKHTDLLAEKISKAWDDN